MPKEPGVSEGICAKAEEDVSKRTDNGVFEKTIAFYLKTIVFVKMHLHILDSPFSFQVQLVV